MGYMIEPAAWQPGTTQSFAYGYDSNGMMTSETWSWCSDRNTFITDCHRPTRLVNGYRT